MLVSTNIYYLGTIKKIFFYRLIEGINMPSTPVGV